MITIKKLYNKKKIFRIFNTLIYYVINLNIVYNLLYRSNISLGRLS